MKDGSKYHEWFVKLSKAVLKLVVVVCFYASIPLVAVAKLTFKFYFHLSSLYQSHRKVFFVLFFIPLSILLLRLIIHYFNPQLLPLVQWFEDVVSAKS